MIYKDQLQRTIVLNSTPKRIISLVPSQTELLVDLGLETSIVGVTKFCVHPSFLRKDKTIVGGTKQVHFDKIRELKPDIILCNKEENTQEMILELEKIAPVHISDIYNLEDSFELIKMYGELFSEENKAKHINSTIQKEFENFTNFIEQKPKLKVAYFIWKSPWMVAANNTFINEMLRINNFENYFKHIERYPEVNMDTICTDDLDVILLSSEPYPFKKEHINMLEGKFQDTKIILVDGEYFSWYGSRLTKAFKYFEKLHQLF
ncbi:ABC transporter substrate-binding protein [Psychroserpens sp. Hel_I_66]|uniref:ABC transporter substrate-binding protein n=1 Tax=Psychroserpens sp. Hel_I_66 TaxID=1250004 RepID=UPI00064647AF|nr:helical backbone metal receptor [Psychroserpens sp. Hel_I_66]